MKKKQKEHIAKMEEKHREAKQKFRTKVETQINDFLKKENEKTLKFSAMDQYHRSVVHDVAEIAGLVTYSFGEEDLDRHIQVGSWGMQILGGKPVPLSGLEERIQSLRG